MMLATLHDRHALAALCAPPMTSESREVKLRTMFHHATCGGVSLRSCWKPVVAQCGLHR